MNNLVIGKMIFHKFKSNINNIEENNLSKSEQNNYLDDIRKELNLEKNNNIKKTINLKIKKDNSNENEKNYEEKNIEKVPIKNLSSKRDIFFKNINSFLFSNKKFGKIQNKKNNFKDNFIDNEFDIIMEKSIYNKLERNMSRKYNFRQLDSVNYYDKNYIILDINTNDRILQDKFYNEIKFMSLLEFFPYTGYISCLINNKLENSNNHFVIENNKDYLDILEDNKNNHNSFFNIININPLEINIGKYQVNCLLFNINTNNYETILNILSSNIKPIQESIFDIYFEKNDDLDISSLYTILNDLLFIKKKFDSKREQWINSK